MITLGLLVIIWGIISFLRVNKKCKAEGVFFNPFNGSFLDYIGIVIGTVVFIIDALFILITYLP